MKVATTERCRWSLSTRRCGQRPPRASHSGSAIPVPITDRSHEAVSAPTANAALFMKASISDRLATAKAAMKTGSRTWSRVIALLYPRIP